MNDIRVDHTELLRFFTAIFVAKGMRAADAETVAEMLVWANLRGVDSHGAMRLPSYLDQIRKGEFDPKAQPSLRPLLPATFVLDCARAAGPVCMMQAATHAIEIADKLGVGVGLVSDTTHTGAVGRYAQWIAERGYAALVMVAGPLFMAYHGAKATSLATSPIAIGIPAPLEGGEPLVLDMATSVTAAGRIRQAAAEGKPIPPGVAIDAEGNPTTDAAKAATLLPLGGPKGSGLSLLFECLTGIMAGMPIITTLAGFTGPRLALQNAMVIVFNVASFRPLADYRHDVGLLVEVVKGLPRRDGFDELLLPGERGGREAELRRRNGIPLSAKLWRELGDIARDVGVPPPHALP
ncbi:MAG TPA: Ldh family oxidoreductase [Xanthobacteraceae bacterium]